MEHVNDFKVTIEIIPQYTSIFHIMFHIYVNMCVCTYMYMYMYIYIYIYCIYIYIINTNQFQFIFLTEAGPNLRPSPRVGQQFGHPQRMFSGHGRLVRRCGGKVVDGKVHGIRGSDMGQCRCSEKRWIKMANCR